MDVRNKKKIGPSGRGFREEKRQLDERRRKSREEAYKSAQENGGSMNPMAQWSDRGRFEGKDDDSHQFGETMKIVYGKEDNA